MEPNQALRSSIDRVYTVFGAHGRPTRIDASPVVDEGVLERLIASPLREIDDQTVGVYAGAALNTAGSAEDYRYFLPRILEQAVRHPVWSGTEPVVIAKKVEAAGWRAWPSEEREAVESLFLAAWAQVRSTCPDEEDAGLWLLGLARIVTDLSTPLAAWLADGKPEARAQLASVLFALRTALLHQEHYWAEVDDITRRKLFDWFTGEAVETALIDASGYVAERHRWLIDAAVDVIAAMRADGFR